MHPITTFPSSTATPDHRTVLNAQGIPDDAAVPKRVASLIDEGFEIFSGLVKAPGIRAEITVEEFGAIYDGDGRNASRTPLEGIFPDAHRLALFAVTVGEAVCGEIRRLFGEGDPALGFTLDTIASAGAEKLVDAMAHDYQESVSQSDPTLSAVRVLPLQSGLLRLARQRPAEAFRGPRSRADQHFAHRQLPHATLEIGLRRVGGRRQRGPRLRHRFRLLYRLRRSGLPRADPDGVLRFPWRSMMDVLSEIAASLRNGDDDRVGQLTQQAIDDGLSAEEILNNGLMSGMRVVGVLFRDHEIFLPEVLLAARAMNRGVDLLKPLLAGEGCPDHREGRDRDRQGRSSRHRQEPGRDHAQGRRFRSDRSRKRRDRRAVRRRRRGIGGKGHRHFGAAHHHDVFDEGCGRSRAGAGARPERSTPSSAALPCRRSSPRRSAPTAMVTTRQTPWSRSKHWPESDRRRSPTQAARFLHSIPIPFPDGPSSVRFGIGNGIGNGIGPNAAERSQPRTHSILGSYMGRMGRPTSSG